MNPATVKIDSGADLETLERIASLAGNARRLEYESEFFKAALRTVPREFLSSCEITGVDHIDDADYGSVRVALFGAEFDLSMVNGNTPEIRHPHLPLGKPIRQLEEYSLIRATKLESDLRRAWLLSWRTALALAVVTIVAFARVPLTSPLGFIPVLLLIFTLSAFFITGGMTETPQKLRRLLFPKRIRQPDAVTLEAFETWRAGITFDAKESR